MQEVPLRKTPEVTLIHGDCLEYMAGLADGAFDLAIVDPPYGIGDTFISASTGAVKRRLLRLHKPMKWDDNIPNKEYFDQLKRISSKQVIWGANYFNCFDGGAVVWYKNRGAPTLSQCEIASVSGQKKVDFISIQAMTGFCSEEQNIHPTQKPVALYRWLLHHYAKPGWRILDTHLGSGSSAIAAHEMGFEFVGIEIDEDYVTAARKRFDLMTRQIALDL